MFLLSYKKYTLNGWVQNTKTQSRSKTKCTRKVMFETYFGSINIKKKQKECILDCLIYLHNKLVLSFLKPWPPFQTYHQVSLTPSMKNINFRWILHKNWHEWERMGWNNPEAHLLKSYMSFQKEVVQKIRSLGKSTFSSHNTETSDISKVKTKLFPFS